MEFNYKLWEDTSSNKLKIYTEKNKEWREIKFCIDFNHYKQCESFKVANGDGKINK